MKFSKSSGTKIHTRFVQFFSEEWQITYNTILPKYLRFKTLQGYVTWRARSDWSSTNLEEKSIFHLHLYFQYTKSMQNALINAYKREKCRKRETESISSSWWNTTLLAPSGCPIFPTYTYTKKHQSAASQSIDPLFCVSVDVALFRFSCPTMLPVARAFGAII